MKPAPRRPITRTLVLGPADPAHGWRPAPDLIDPMASRSAVRSARSALPGHWLSKSIGRSVRRRDWPDKSEASPTLCVVLGLTYRAPQAPAKSNHCSTLSARQYGTKPAAAAAVSRSRDSIASVARRAITDNPQSIFAASSTSQLPRKQISQRVR